MSVQYRVEMKDITKRYGGTLALRGFSINIKPGEIHALIGENGAGKSTVVKILSGAAHKDSGAIFIDGEEVEINSPHRGKELGISVIYQEFALAPDLTVAENIHLHKLGEAGGFINWKRLRAQSAAIIESLGVDIRPEAAVGKLSVAYQQIVEIAKALSE
ncbi:MAG: ATP-binding cassette domain-containing protein, partial [Treponema sp.]|nr:ATP-binding cassette domain-containing protein [Treponema sp.]